MSFTKLNLAGFILVATTLCSAATQAAPVSWSNPNGAGTDFTWSNGANDAGLANDPTFNNNVFLFFPSLKAFTAQGTGSALETIRVTLTPGAGRRISSIGADVFGDATVLDGGAAGYTATLDALKHGTATHATNSFSPADITTQGAFADHFALAVPANFGTVDLSFDLNLHASGPNAFSELKVLRLSIETAPAVVPLPAAIASFPVGAALVGFASRRMKRKG